jgi:hypothetical protein
VNGDDRLVSRRRDRERRTRAEVAVLLDEDVTWIRFQHFAAERLRTAEGTDVEPRQGACAATSIVGHEVRRDGVASRFTGRFTVRHNCRIAVSG